VRRSYFVGPLVLIAIGVLFLAKNLLPDLHIAELFSTYWPALLIVVGVAKLIERIGWTGGPLPRPGQGNSL
jgi:hypothetical protein